MERVVGEKWRSAYLASGVGFSNVDRPGGRTEAAL